MKVFRTLAPVLVALLVMLGAGCGGGNNSSTTSSTPTTTQPATSGGAPQTTTVGLNEYSFKPDNVTIKQGGTVQAKNEGAIAHNLTIEQGSDPTKKTKKLAGTSTFLPNKSEKLTVNLTPGKYAMICTVAGHQQLGMRGTVTVK